MWYGKTRVTSYELRVTQLIYLKKITENFIAHCDGIKTITSDCLITNCNYQ